MAISAWIDESMCYGPGDDAVYVLAAALIDDEVTEDVRSDVASLVPSRRGRIHWRDADDMQRRKLVQSVATMDALHLVVVGTRLRGVRQERGRRLCMQELLWHVGELGVRTVTAESRMASQNQQDLAAVHAWRANRVLPRDLRIDFARAYGEDREPLLWLPDIVAGAVSMARGGRDEQFAGALEAVVDERTITLS